MQIGQAAAASGVSAKMIRHYEHIGLIALPDRRESNYRVYAAEDVHRLRFIRRARDLGFPIDRIRDLLRLWSDRDRASAEVKTIAVAHLAELDRKIAAMRDMADTLRRLAEACAGSARPDCPILNGLELGMGAPSPESSRSSGRQSEKAPTGGRALTKRTV